MTALLLHNSQKTIFIISHKRFEKENDFIYALKKGDKQAFAELFSRYSGALMGIIVNIVPPKKLAEEVLKETLSKVVKDIAKYQTEKCSLFTWLSAKARKIAISWLNEIQYPISVLEDAKSTNAKLHINPQLSLFNKILMTEHYAVFNSVYYKGHTVDHVAAELEIPVEIVKTKLRNALLLFRKNGSA